MKKTAAATSNPSKIFYHVQPNGSAKEVQKPSTPKIGYSVTWLEITPENKALLKEIGLPKIIIESLTAEETRPRCTTYGNNALLTLRGVNLTEGAEPEDMISARFWLTENSIIGLWRRPLIATNNMFTSLKNNTAPTTATGFLAKFALRLADHTEPVIAALNEQIDTLEDSLLSDAPPTSRTVLAETRRTAIILRRYLLPQRDALTTLSIEDFKWLKNEDRSHIREAADRVIRIGEELDAIRDRTQIIHDQIMDKRAESMNQQMLVLSVVAAIFLPLGFLTGLLGINVGGMPGTENPLAFWWVILGLIILTALLVWLFKRWGMLR